MAAGTVGTTAQTGVRCEQQHLAADHYRHLARCHNREREGEFRLAVAWSCDRFSFSGEQLQFQCSIIDFLVVQIPVYSGVYTPNFTIFLGRTDR